MNKKLILWSLGLLLLFVSCQKEQMDDCISSSGRERSETRYLADFSSLEVSDYVDVYITQDLTKPVYAKITCGSNLLGQIVSDVDQGTLYIENQNVCNWVRGFKTRIKVLLNVHQLAQVRITEDAAIVGSDLVKVEALKLLNESSNDIYMYVDCGYVITEQKLQGDISLDGKTVVLVAYLEGLGKLNAQGMKGEYVFVNHYGRNDANVFAFKGLEAYIYNSGNVYYYYQEPLESKRLARLGTGYMYLK